MEDEELSTENANIEDLPEGFESLANIYFPPLSLSESNHDILRKVMQIPNLSNYVVERLREEEQSWNWPLQDDDIKALIKNSCIRAGIELYQESAELNRWFCLIYMVASVMEEYACGNLVRISDITGEYEDIDIDTMQDRFVSLMDLVWEELEE